MQTPTVLLLSFGDFNHTCLSKALPRYKQHVDCSTRKDETLDHCYTVYKGAYHASARAPLGKSDHNTVILIPAYRQKKKTVKKWSLESTEALRGCLECTDWSVFEHACTDLDEYTDTVTAYVSLCVESCIPTRTVCGYANDKPWFTKEVKNKLVAKGAAFRSGDGKEFRRAKYDARRANARAKAEYKDKLEDQFASNNTHAVWQGLQTITHYKAKSATISSDPTLPDRLNEFYARFDRQYSAAAEPLHLHPPSSLTPVPTAGPPPQNTSLPLVISCRLQPPPHPPSHQTGLWSSAVASSSSPHPPSHQTGLWSSAVASSSSPHPSSHRTGLWSSAVASSPHPTPPPTGPASGHQLSPPAPTPTPPPTGPASGHHLSLQAPTTNPPPTGPASGHQLSPPAPPTGPSAAARHQPPPPDLPSRPLPSLHLWSDAVPGPPGPPFVIQEREVRILFRSQNPRKASGPDNVPPATLRSCADQLAPVFTALFNKSLEQCHVPRCFKTSTIVPVPKKPSIASLNDYRPVALTSVVMKVFERLVLRSLKAASDHQLDPHQFAYWIRR